MPPCRLACINCHLSRLCSCRQTMLNPQGKRPLEHACAYQRMQQLRSAAQWHSAGFGNVGGLPQQDEQ